MIKSKATLNTKKRIDYKVNKTEHIQNYDFDNKYPQRCEDILNDSRTGKATQLIRQKFIAGGGLTNVQLSKVKVNRKGCTVDQLNRLISTDIANYSSFAIHVQYNALFEITSLTYVPWSNVRYTDGKSEEYKNKVAIYNDWGRIKNSKISIKDIDFIDLYNPNPDVISAQVEALSEYDKNGELIKSGWQDYKGQVYIYTPNTGEYPLSFFDAVLEDMMTEGNMKRFKFRSSEHNFLASHLLITSAYEDDQEADKFSERVKEFQGSDNAGSIWWIEKESPEDILELKKVEIQDYDGLYEYTEKSTTESIILNSLIPQVLLLSIPGKLGTSKEIEEATAFYNGITSDERLILEETYQELFPKFVDGKLQSNDYSIITFKFPNPNTQIAPEYFPYYTANEIREANGDMPLTEEQKIELKQKESNNIKTF